MTQAAQEFVKPLTFQALSGNPVHIDLLDMDEENAMGHINLARWADMMVIAPATANTIAKCAHGLADDLVSALFLASTCPVYMAPAMNQAMWGKAVTQENIQRLVSQGVQFIGPDAGDQACGESGYGRMAEPAGICLHLLSDENAALKPGILQSINVVVTAGPTREYLDPVRYLTNRSSGKMGYAVAQAARQAGANVTLISGPVALTPPEGVKVINVETAAHMYDAVMEHINNAGIFIASAAVADYSPDAAEAQKIKKKDGQINLLLQKTKDILAEVAALEEAPFLVGFAAETTELEAYALAKLNAKKLDMIAANWVGRTEGGFDSDQNALDVYWQSGRKSMPLMPKSVLASQLIELIAMRFHEKNRIKNTG